MPGHEALTTDNTIRGKISLAEAFTENQSGIPAKARGSNASQERGCSMSFEVLAATYWVNASRGFQTRLLQSVPLTRMTSAIGRPLI